jgi:N-acetylmuramoyl-L-alanine amidase
MSAHECLPMNADRPDSPLLDSSVADRIHPSPNHGERKGCTAPDCVILHYTGMAEADAALRVLCNPAREVSCHYFIHEDGQILQLVPESRRAWHAGKSSWHGETDMNSRSIGVEIVNPGHDLTKSPPEPYDYPDFPDVQIDAVIRLVKDIAARWKISPARILAHSDIAPGRKIDPGEKFPWNKLAAQGLGLWPSSSSSQAPRNDGMRTGPSYRAGDEGMPVAALQSMLVKFGYGIEITGVYDQRTVDVVTAFQRHWRQGCINGVADGETLEVLRMLMEKAGA